MDPGIFTPAPRLEQLQWHNAWHVAGPPDPVPKHSPGRGANLGKLNKVQNPDRIPVYGLFNNNNHYHHNSNK